MKNSNTNLGIDSETDGDRSLAAKPNGLYEYLGRIGRLEYFWTTLITNLILFALSFFLAKAESTDFGVGFWLAILVMIQTVYVSFAAGIKRCHDLGKSGWLYLLAFVPIVNVALGLYLLSAKGKCEANQYGPPSIALGDAASGSAELTQAKSVPFSDARNSAAEPALKEYSSDISREDHAVFAAGFNEDDAYTDIARELETASMDKGLWLKAMVQTGGGDERNQAIAYTSLRMEKLREAFRAMPAHNYSSTHDGLEHEPKQESNASA